MPGEENTRRCRACGAKRERAMAMSEISRPVIVWLVLTMAMLLAASALNPVTQNSIFSRAPVPNIQAA